MKNCVKQPNATNDLATRLEFSIRQLTLPINGQFPRPWMTDTAHPEMARVFIVGYNQATGFPVALQDSHETYLDALFNRNGRSCRELYEQMRGDKGPSPTRVNIDRLSKMLADVGIKDTLETNVICYSTPMSEHLNHQEHRGGKSIGQAIFLELLYHIRPQVIIAHGARTKKELERVLLVTAPPLPTKQGSPICGVHANTTVQEALYDPMIFFVPSLAPPKWNSWANWANEHLEAVCVHASKFLAYKSEAAKC